MTESKLKVVNPWYHRGLDFKCTECGKCCTGSPGHTWVSEDEIVALAAYLKLSSDEFGKKYLRKVGSRYSLLENPVNYDCVFLKDNKCRVYPARPTQCRTYPWWLQNLTSEEAWQKAASNCEGIQKGGETVPCEKIEEALARQMQYEKNSF